jgi:DNA modification methylase
MEIFYPNPNQKIIQADVIEGLSEVENASINLAIIDYPYFEIKVDYGNQATSVNGDFAQFLEWAYTVADMVVSKLSPTGSLYVFAGHVLNPYIQIYLSQRLCLKNVIVWHRGSASAQSSRKFTNVWEPLLFFTKHPRQNTFNRDAVSIAGKVRKRGKIMNTRGGKLYNTTKVQPDVFELSPVKGASKEFAKYHPLGQKPEKLIRLILDASSNPDDTVLDVFGGTCAVAKVAQQLRLKSVTVEQNPAYVAASIERLKK